jgi:hypothetical protein
MMIINPNEVKKEEHVHKKGDLRLFKFDHRNNISGRID